MYQPISIKTIQPKSKISQPGDKFELEADAMADQVMRMPKSSFPIQRKCANCEEDQLQMKPLADSITPVVQMESIEEKEEMLQAESEGGSMNASAALSSQLSQSKGGGTGLSNAANQQMSSAFGTDFNRVRVHTDPNAIKMNRSIGARAFTNGNDVYFNKGEYQPGSRDGQHLLAHELTHVVQQGKGNTSENRNSIQRYVAYRRWDQTRTQSEQEFETTAPTQTYTEGMGRRYKRQSARFNKRYERRDQKGKLTKMNKRKKEGWRHPKRRPVLISDDGRMVVENRGTSSIRAWADETLINDANRVLKGNNSYVKIKKENSDLIVGNVPKNEDANPYKGNFKSIKAVHTTPDGKEQDMTKSENTTDRKIQFRNEENAIAETERSFKLRDCGEANNILLGMGYENRVYKSKDGELVVKTENPNDTIQSYIQLVMQKEFQDNADISDKGKAYKAYGNLSADEKNRVDTKYGLNILARPDLGEGVTTVASEYNKETSREGYNYHFATNIMQSGSTEDYIALEGLADHSIWYFSMYGTLKEQSFHEKTTNIVDGTDISTVVDK